MASIRAILAVCALVVLVVELVCASPGNDYDFQVIVQPGSKLRQANAGVRDCAHAVSSLNRLCSESFALKNSSFRPEMRHHLTTLLSQSWKSAFISAELVSNASRAMCCVLRSGSIWQQYAAARVIAAIGNASTSSRRAMCSVIGVGCSREVDVLASMVHTTHNATSSDDLVSALQAISSLSVCVPAGAVMPALHAGLAHASRSVREAASSAVFQLLSDIQTTIALSGREGDFQYSRRFHELLSDELLDWGILLLVVKHVREDAQSKAVITALQPVFDVYTEDYLVAAQSMLAQQRARDCRSLLKAGIHAALHRNVSTAALLAWAHTRSARWATESCPAPSPLSPALFPCILQRHQQAASSSSDSCLEHYISYLQCNTQAQSLKRLSPHDASAACRSIETAARRCDYAHDGLCDWDGASPMSFPALRTASTWTGRTVYHAYDLYFRVALELYGEWARGEVEFVMRFMPPGATFVDAGAHVGTISLAVARQLGPSSTVIAIEASRLSASLAQANAAAGGLHHMRVIHAALADSTQLCFMARSHNAYTTIQNMGGHELIRCPERVQAACAARNCAVHGETFFDGSETYEWVPSMLIDDLGLQRCDVLKMDVEAMEGVVARGARHTITAFKPMVFYENNAQVVLRANNSSPSFMEEFGYTCYPRAEPLWRSSNWASATRDVFHGSESHMMFCVHPEAHMGPDSFFND